MNLLSSFWRYWKWLCVALMTSFVLLGLIALLVVNFEMPEPDKAIRECIESGGIWEVAPGQSGDSASGFCKAAG